MVDHTVSTSIHEGPSVWTRDTSASLKEYTSVTPSAHVQPNLLNVLCANASSLASDDL